MDWNAYFEMMKDWKRLPAYKAEPRIDSLIGYYMRELLSEFCGDRMVGIIPELPIRLGTVRPKDEDTPYADRSYKVDFYLLGESDTNYFVEFKTDSGSRRDGQDKYLQASQDKGMKAIVDGITRIASVSSYKTKYDHLLGKLESLGLIDGKQQYSGPSDAIAIVYVQPHRKDTDSGTVVDFNWIADWLDRQAGGDYETALARTMRHWAGD